MTAFDPTQYVPWEDHIIQFEDPILNVSMFPYCILWSYNYWRLGIEKHGVKFSL